MRSITWPQVLAWRLRRQFLDQPAAAPVLEIVSRLAGVQAQVASAAELAIAIRQLEPEQGAVSRALAGERTLVKTWAMRGTLHLLPVEEAGAYLSLLASTKIWERPAWQKAFGATPADLEAIAAAATQAMAGGRTLTREELTAEIVSGTGSRHLADMLGSGWGTLLKPLAYWGVLCHGPSQGSSVTFAQPQSWLPGWRGVPEPDAAAPVVIRTYLDAHGPATPEVFDAWLTRGYFTKSKLRRWFDELASEVVTVDVEGTPMYIAARYLDELEAQSPSETVCLLPAFDQYVLAAGTSAQSIIAAHHRPEVSRAAGWLSPVVVHRGRVAGVWELKDGGAAVTLFEDVPPDLLERATGRIRALAGRLL